VRICALLEVASDDDGPQYVVGTTSFDVVPAPNVGGHLVHQLGPRAEDDEVGHRSRVGGERRSRRPCRGDLRPVVNWWNWLWGDRSASVTKALQANQAPQKKLQQMSTSGNALGQIAAPGGVLGRMPELPRMVNGKIVYSGNGVLAEGTGPLVTGDDDGVLAGVGSGTTALGKDNVSKVVAAGGGNVVAAGAGRVAPGGGNVVARGRERRRAGGGNVVAPGGGNVVAPVAGTSSRRGRERRRAGWRQPAGGGFVVAAGGGNVVAAGGATSAASWSGARE
jgi:hypothetical protein